MYWYLARLAIRPVSGGMASTITFTVPSMVCTQTTFYLSTQENFYLIERNLARLQSPKCLLEETLLIVHFSMNCRYFIPLNRRHKWTRPYGIFSSHSVILCICCVMNPNRVFYQAMVYDVHLCLIVKLIGPVPHVLSMKTKSVLSWWWMLVFR